MGRSESGQAGLKFASGLVVGQGMEDAPGFVDSCGGTQLVLSNEDTSNELTKNNRRIQGGRYQAEIGAQALLQGVFEFWNGETNAISASEEMGVTTDAAIFIAGKMQGFRCVQVVDGRSKSVVVTRRQAMASEQVSDVKQLAHLGRNGGKQESDGVFPASQLGVDEV